MMGTERKTNANRRVRDIGGQTGLESLEPRLLLSGSLAAEFAWVDNTDQLTGYTTADLQVSTDTDWLSAALLLELNQGSIYQDPNGSNTEPNSALFGIAPTLEFDSYVAANGHNVLIAGGAGDVYGDTLQFDESQLDISWLDTATDDTGTINLARITLSDDAAGTWSLKLTNAGGETFFSLNNAFTNGELAEPPAPPPPPPPPSDAVDGDFTGDGKPDIFWHSTRNGKNSVWQMNGISVVDNLPVQRLRNTDWKLVGSADFTGDGKNDLLWHNTADGRNSVWEMDGTDLVAGHPIKKLGNRKWQVAGVGDLNGDGHDDILWRHTRSGRNVLWEMDGLDYIANAELKTITNLKWQAGGIADFNGDGKDDILWRNIKNGKNTLWEMDGTDFVTATAINSVKNQNWQIAALADYTGDGHTDILWRNTRTGANTVWDMDGSTLLGALALPAKTDTDDQPPSPILGLWDS